MIRAPKHGAHKGGSTDPAPSTSRSPRPPGLASAIGHRDRAQASEGVATRELPLQGGEALPPDVRAQLAPGLQRDFVGVRIHHDAAAAASARALGANAYAVGGHVVFGEGRYAPRSPTGVRLLAHELAHVAQQPELGSHPPEDLPLSQPGDATEREAAAAAASVLAGRAAAVPSRDEFRVARDVPDASLPDLSTQPPPRDWAGVSLTLDDRARIVAFLEGVNVERAKREDPKAKGFREFRPLPIPEAPAEVKRDRKFVIHTTDVPRMAPERLEEHVTLGKKGPLGEGPAAYVRSASKTAPAHVEVARAKLYEDVRPTATRHEQGVQRDLDKESKQFSGILREVWKNTSKTVRTTALDSVYHFPGAENQKQRARGQRQIEEKDEKTITTGWQWALEGVCRRAVAATPETLEGLARTPKAAGKLREHCTQALKTFDRRRALIPQFTNIEIEKPESKKPTYSDEELDGVVQLYLMAALEIGTFPAETTHLEVDENIKGGHADPAAFDFPRLNEKLAKALGHPSGSSYGKKK